jgi:prevent-host-death family protein
MRETSVGIRELKSRLSAYLHQVKGGTTLLITERGKPIGRIVPLKPSLEERMEELVGAGLASWNGRRLPPCRPVAHAQGRNTVAGLLLEDRE